MKDERILFSLLMRLSVSFMKKEKECFDIIFHKEKTRNFIFNANLDGILDLDISYPYNFGKFLT